MDSIYEGLRQAIDNQNIDEVKCFINNNPEINYDEVCPDGMSLLWLALMPKKGKNISPKLIEFLVNYKKPDKSLLVNPSQTFLNCKPVRYLSLLKDSPILTTIKEAVSNYPALPVERATNQLAAIARAYSKNSQTEHYLLAEKFSSNSRIIELSRRFGQEGLVRLHFKDKDFRGYDFSGLNLNDSVFENCHLPFSGVNLQCERVTFKNCSLANMDRNITEGEGLRNLGLLLKSEMLFSPLVTQFYLQAITTHKTLMQHSNLLFTAIKKGRLDVFNAILENEHCTPDLLEVTKEGNTVLMEAVEQGEMGIAIAILNSKHCTSRLLEKVNSQEANVLMIAVWIGQTEVVKVILNNKYCTPEFLEQRCPNNKPILMVAIERLHSNIAIAILSSKHCSLKLLEQSHNNNLTILMIATSLGQVEVVQAILEHEHCSQAFLEKKCPNETTVLMAAIMSRFTHIAIAIIESKHCRPKFLEELHAHNLNVLIVAASCGQTEVVKAILKKNCTKEFLEQIDSKNNTAESIARQRKYLDILAVLKEYNDRLLANIANIDAIFDANLEDISNIDLGNINPFEQHPAYEIELGKRSRSAFFSEQSFNSAYQEIEHPPKRFNI